MSLHTKTALVIGGGTGIGSGCALALAHAGCHTAIAGRREEKLADVAKQHTGDKPILSHSIDATDRASVQSLIEWATGELGQIDILVNSAGMNVPKRSMKDLDPADWDCVMQVNATAAYNLMHAVLPQMRKRQDGLIITISSVAGVRALELAGVAYCASKFAVTALGVAVGNELRNEGVRVTNIYPGEVETPILDQRPEPVSAERREKMLQPEDIGAAVVMIASLPPRAHVPDLTIKPTVQEFV